MEYSVAEKTLNDGLARIKTTTDLNALRDVDLVVESIVEDLDIKKGLYKHLGGILKPDAVLGTNTSSFSVGELVC